MSSNIVMNKSQLRRLAREYALGNLEEGEYLHRRRKLVDDIASGTVAIVREVPPPPPQAYSEDPTTKVSIAGREAPRISPAALLIAIVVVAGVVWMVIPTGEQQGSGIQQSTVAPPVSRARSLIDEFVAEKDFSAFSIASFKESWSHLSYAEKREAYSAHWFNELINAISDEIKAQNALAGSEDPAAAVETGRRLSDFAAFLGISEYVTEFRGLPPQPAGAVAASDPGIGAVPPMNDLATPEVTLAPVGPDGNSAPVNPVPPQSPGTVTVSVDAQGQQQSAPAPMTDSEWLNAQPPSAFTLQLFAVNQLDEIEKLIADNPDVDMQVLVSVAADPRYRVVYGAFDSEQAARGAYAGLPEGIRQAQPVPLVKSISALREEIGDARRAGGVNASKYTLQVLATDSADSARRLQADYPTLKLSLLETTSPYTRYRVLYGTFDSKEMAKQAAGGLPPKLLKDVGNPLIKTVSELQAVKR